MDEFKMRLDAIEKQAGAIEEKVSAHAEVLKQHGRSIKEMRFKHEKLDAGLAARSVFIPTFKVEEGEQNAVTKRKIYEFFALSFKDVNCSVQEISLMGRKAGACSALVTFGDILQRNMVLKRADARNRIDNVILFPARTLQQMEQYNKRKIEAEKKQLQALSKKYGNEKSGGGN
ncbi:hypothetical protein Ddc_10181 [Ditylenchus destructor]|nr:hypothetical protein Ddc_10181 [Ditylenchus destructor]